MTLTVKSICDIILRLASLSLTEARKYSFGGAGGTVVSELKWASAPAVEKKAPEVPEFLKRFTNTVNTPRYCGSL